MVSSGEEAEENSGRGMGDNSTLSLDLPQSKNCQPRYRLFGKPVRPFQHRRVDNGEREHLGNLTSGGLEMDKEEHGQNENFDDANMKITQKEGDLATRGLGRCLICRSSIREYEHKILLESEMGPISDLAQFCNWMGNGAKVAKVCDALQGTVLCDICTQVACQFVSMQEKVISKLGQVQLNEKQEEQTFEAKQSCDGRDDPPSFPTTQESSQEPITAPPSVDMQDASADPVATIETVKADELYDEPTPSSPSPQETSEEESLSPAFVDNKESYECITILVSPPTSPSESPPPILNPEDQKEELAEELPPEESVLGATQENSVDYLASASDHDSLTSIVPIENASPEESVHLPNPNSDSQALALNKEEMLPPLISSPENPENGNELAVSSGNDVATSPPAETLLATTTENRKRKRGRPPKNKENGAPTSRRSAKRKGERQSPNVLGRQKCWKEREGKLYFRDVEVKKGTKDKYLCPASPCPYSSVSRISLSRHFNKVHVDSSSGYQCEYCDSKYFYYHSDLVQHMIKRHGNGFQCTICKVTLCSQASLRHHRQVTHNRIKPHFCEYCDRGFGSKMELKVHTRRHTGEKPFVCPVCNVRFACRQSLKRHLPLRHPTTAAAP